MSIANTNWLSSLAPGSDLPPPDVFFLVKDEEEESGGQSKKIGAHRLLLAGVSPVFKGMFFGPMKDEAEVVEVKETTPEAFDTMIKFFYHPPAPAQDGDKFNLNHVRCPQKLFELLTLANRYQVLDLATMTSEAIESLTMTKETVIFTATIAQKYKMISEDLSTKLSLKCLSFLFGSTTADIFSLIEATRVNFPEASLDILHELINVKNATLLLPGI